MAKAKKMELFVGASAISGALKSIQTKSKTLEKLDHKTACSIVSHIEKHGDITLAQRMIDEISATKRKDALIKWFLAFGKLTWDQEGKAFKYSKAKKTLLEDAIETPYWVFTPPPEYKPMDLMVEIRKLVKRANTKLADEENADKNTIDTKTLEVLESLVPVAA